jgi:hypothetical protein
MGQEHGARVTGQPIRSALDPQSAPRRTQPFPPNWTNMAGYLDPQTHLGTSMPSGGGHIIKALA